MFEKSALKDLLSKKELSPKEKLLICLAVDPSAPKKAKCVRELAVSSGLRTAAKWNVSDYLSKCKPYAVRTNGGWELTGAGKTKVAELVGPHLPSPTTLGVSALRNHLPSIPDPYTRSFVEEAIRCFETRLFRAAIVFSWVGAVSVLHNHVQKGNLAAFNVEASKRDAKWKPAVTSDDIGRMKEHDFLQILCAISVIGKNVKDELEVCLKLRNGCGHPNSLQVGEHKASAHVETLIQNVFSKY